jgi:uncharacterized protein
MTEENHLINEKSPYLLQHAHNPVDWYPWGEEAFARAREEQKPVFLSIGYATCHWCHVMAHESFEDEEVARLINRHFVAVKVDREERPDIDQIYMSVCQALTGRGGWPLSLFLTPERKPFFAGTYFPKTSRLGMSGLLELLNQIASLWEKDRDRILKAGDEITQSVQSRVSAVGTESVLDLKTLETGYDQLVKNFDSRWGGFGQAPKFPTPHHLTFLIRWDRRRPDSRAREIVTKTLEAMRFGGIFDQIGLGFHRYSVDAQWLVPHFEKMLYDQALLAMAYTEAYQAWQDPFHAQVIREIFTYVLRDMTAPEGGFFSAEDADSEGREGLFYVWKPEEVTKVLGPELGALFCRCFDIQPGGNFEEGESIPHLPVSLSQAAAREKVPLEELTRKLEAARQTLFDLREQRIHPLKDDKILTAWNGLIIAALAKAAQALGEPAFARAAARSAAFILKKMRDPSGRLYRRFREGHLANPGYLEDYAYLIWGLIELYEATFELDFLQEAITLNRMAIDLFWDEEQGGFFFTARDGEPLIAREKEIYDGAVPSGNSVGLLNLLRLGKITGEADWSEKADQLLRNFSAAISGYPMAYTQLLNALDWVVGPSQEIVIAGDKDHPVSREMVRLVREAFLPNKILLFKSTGPEGEALNRVAAFAESMVPASDKPTAYVCEQYACRQPVRKAEELRKVLF